MSIGRIKRRARETVAVAALLTAACVDNGALAQNIDTTPQWNGTTFISSWGMPNTATYGQTITPTGLGQSRLTGFTFELFQQSGTPPQYQAFVFQWDATNNRITGPALFTSGILTAPAGAAFVAVNIPTPGGVALNPGTQYVLMFTTSSVSQVNTSAYRWGALTNNTTYPGGQFVFNNNGTNFGSLSTTNWSFIAEDLAFIATFSPVFTLPNFQNIAQTQNQLAVGSALQGVAPVTPTVTPLTGLFLNFPSDPAAGRAALDALSGEGTSGTQTTAFLAGNMFMQTMGQQADAWRNGDRAGTPGALPYAPEPTSKNPLYAADLKGPVYKAPPPVYAPTWHVWASAFGATQTVSGDATGLGTAGLSDRTYGGALGFDYQAMPDLLIGIGGGGSSSSFSVSDRATSGSLDGAHVGAYGMKTWGSAYATATLAYSHFNNSTTRTIAGVGPAETATGSFGSDMLAGRLEVGKTWLYNRIGVTPFAAIQASQLWQKGYSETSTIIGDGPGILGLSYASTNTTSLPSFLGVQLDGRMPMANGGFFSPYLRAAWVHEFRPSRTITPTFISLPGATFTVDGARAASDSAKVDAGVRIALTRNVSLIAAFNSEFSNTGQIYAGNGGLRVTW
jgi:outer membrane autotransporter protein